MYYSDVKILKHYSLMKECLIPKTERLFHYTSQTSFCAMFKEYIDKIQKDDQGSIFINIFASQMQYLNDKQEFREGVSIVKEAGTDINNLFESIFISCFCGKEDLLSQWKYYGKDCGISIEFDFSSDVIFCWYDIVEQGSSMIPSQSYWSKLIPYNVIYNDHKIEYEKILNTLKSKPFKDINDKNAANIFVPYCKNTGFAEEDESRLVLYPINTKVYGNKYLLTKIDYRETKGKIVPQFTCKIAYEHPTKKCAIPIKSVMIGPGYNQRLVFNSVINMLESDRNRIRFYSDDEIEKIIQNKPEINDTNNLGIVNGRVTYKTDNGILISMSTIPLRD